MLSIYFRYFIVFYSFFFFIFFIYVLLLYGMSNNSDNGSSKSFKAHNPGCSYLTNPSLSISICFGQYEFPYVSQVLFLVSNPIKYPFKFKVTIAFSIFAHVLQIHILLNEWTILPNLCLYILYLFYSKVELFSNNRCMYMSKNLTRWLFL